MSEFSQSLIDRLKGKGRKVEWITLDKGNLGREVSFGWLETQQSPLMLDVPSEECHPIRTLTLEHAKLLRDWLSIRIKGISFDQSETNAVRTPAIVRMKPGEMPVEPGWYLIDCAWGRIPAEVKWGWFKKRLLIRPFNSNYDHPIKKFNFVARLYPNLIDTVQEEPGISQPAPNIDRVTLGTALHCVIALRDNVAFDLEGRPRTDFDTRRLRDLDDAKTKLREAIGRVDDLTDK